jgi:hypothetical protein
MPLRIPIGLDDIRAVREQQFICSGSSGSQGCLPSTKTAAW